MGLAVFLHPEATSSEPITPTQSIVVVCDDNYPPYIFRDGDGSLRGIVPEHWALWEQRTGVKVDFRAMDWVEAQKQMAEGKADVIDTIFFTKERAKTLEFSPPYAQIEVPVYMDAHLTGINDIPSMSGFTVGVKAGDAVLTYLAARGIDTVKEYPSYEAIVKAAKSGEIKIFSIDKPAAIFFLSKYNLSSQFRESFVLYTGHFHRAVRKDNIALIKLLERGFKSISPQEYKAIDRKWLNPRLDLPEILWHWRYGFLALATILLLLMSANFILSQRVRRKSTELVKSQQIRQESENRYRILTENMKDVVWIVDTETLNLLYVSPSVFKLRGYTAEEVVGNHITKSLFPAQADAVENMIRSRIQEFKDGKVTTDTFFVTELRQPRRDGTPVTTEIVAHFWINSTTGKLEIHGSTRNIEERKRVENELRESRRRYAALMDRLPGMAYRRRNDSKWTLEFVSSGCAEVTGYTVDELTRNTQISYADLVKPDESEKLREKWDHVLRARRSFEGEYQILGKTGDWRWVSEKAEGVYDHAGNVIAIEGFISNITARRHAEAERERLMSAIEQSSEAITITDPEANIVYVNPAFCKISGYTKEESIGRNSRILQSGMQSREFYQQMWAVLQAGKTWNGQFVNKHRDGTLYTEEATISPAFDTNGNIVSYIAVKRDITQQIVSASEKSALQAQVLQAQKLESVGCLAGGVAHDFNNMLQAILGYAEMALEQIPDDQPLRDDILEIKKTALRSMNLTRQLLTFARKQPIEPKETDINEVVDSIMNVLRRLVGENIELVWNPSPTCAHVLIDKGQFEQIVFNLCINARDAMKTTGRIEISTSTHEIREDDPSRIVGVKPGKYVEVSIKDNGAGIPSEIKKRIFEPFFTTKPLGQGTGLGLSVVYGIVTQFGGVIHLETELGQGSDFQIFLPAFSESVTEKIVPYQGQTIENPVHATILVVDDEALILRPTRQLLESLGHQVIAANSPGEGIEVMKESADRIDLLISDVMMPGMSGPEMLVKLLEIDPKLKYIFMSGHTADLLEKQGLDPAATNFLEKPFTRQELNVKVQEVLKG